MIDLVDMFEQGGPEPWISGDDYEHTLPKELITEAFDLDQFESLDPVPLIVIKQTSEAITMSKKAQKKNNKSANASVKAPNTNNKALVLAGKQDTTPARIVKSVKGKDKETVKDVKLAGTKPPEKAPEKPVKVTDPDPIVSFIKTAETETPKEVGEVVKTGDPIMDLLNGKATVAPKSTKPDVKSVPKPTKPDVKSAPKPTKPDVKSGVDKEASKKKLKTGAPSIKSQNEVPASFQNFSKKFVAGKDEVFVPLYEYTHSKLFGSMSAEEREDHKKTAIVELGKLLKQGDAVITVVRVVTKSKFTAKCHIFHRKTNGELVNITRHVKSLESAQQDDTDLFMLTPHSSNFAATVSEAIFNKKDALSEIRI